MVLILGIAGSLVLRGNIGTLDLHIQAGLEVLVIILSALSTRPQQPLEGWRDCSFPPFQINLPPDYPVPAGLA